MTNSFASFYFVTFEPDIHICSKMPTLFNAFGLRFFFYSNEHKPIHIHVKNADGEAKFNVETMQWIKNKGLKAKDLKLAVSLIEENKSLIINTWNYYF